MGLENEFKQGDFAKYVGYNAKEGSWYKDKIIEVQNPTFIVNFPNIKKAWMYFEKGSAPDFRLFPSIETTDAEFPRPDGMTDKGKPKYQKGLVMQLFSNDAFDGLVDFSSNSILVCSAFWEMYLKYIAEEKNNSGMLPVISSKKSKENIDKHGNFKPVLSLIKWVKTEAFNKSNVVPITAAPTTGGVAPQVIKAAAVSEF